MPNGLLETIAEIEARGGQLQMEGTQIIYSVPPEVAHLVDRLRPYRNEVARLLSDREKEMAVEAEAPGVPAPAQCPPLPDGVRLTRYTRKRPPLAVAPVFIVTDVDRFIRLRLEELEATLQHPSETATGRSRFQIVAQLAEAGLEVAIETLTR